MNMLDRKVPRIHQPSDDIVERRILGGHNLTEVQSDKLRKFLDAYWPNWRSQYDANEETGMRFLEIREAYIAGCIASS